MIITCSQCHTRFKVGDDKLASGPIRVRCSKCNFVFMASSEPQAVVASQPPSSALPATAVHVPPSPSGMMPPLSPTPRPSAGPITGMFRAFGAAGEGPSPSGFSSPTNRSGIFRAPSSDFRAPPADPFAALGPTPSSAPPGFAPPSPQSAAPPSFPPANPPGFSAPGFAPPAPSFAAPAPHAPTAPPFTSSPPAFAPPAFAPPPAPPPAPFGQAADPFARTMTPGVKNAGVDPFGRTMTPGGRAAAPDPFAATGGAAAADPFGSAASPFGGAAPDPFGGLPTAAATPHAKDPFGLGVAAAPSAPPGFAPSPPGDESGRTEAYSAADIFGAGASLSTDPFGAGSSPPNAGAGNGAVEDPFAALDAAGSADSMVPTSPPGPSLPPPPPEESDPFAQIGLDLADEPARGAREEHLDRPPPKAAPRADAASSAPRPAAAQASFAPPPPTAAERTKLRRLETAQRARALAWAALQSLIFAAFVVVAVVVARGGTPADLLRGDLAAALGGPRVEGDLAIEETRVRRRTLPTGLEVLIVSGVVHNTTDNPVPGARVEVSVGGAPLAGWAWSTLDGTELEAAATAEGLAALLQRTPASASLAPGERAPFVLVGPAPVEGQVAAFSVQVAAPPPPPPAPAPPATP